MTRRRRGRDALLFGWISITRFSEPKVWLASRCMKAIPLIGHPAHDGRIGPPPRPGSLARGRRLGPAATHRSRSSSWP
jgi:hypothetical protein